MGPDQAPPRSHSAAGWGCLAASVLVGAGASRLAAPGAPWWAHGLAGLAFLLLLNAAFVLLARRLQRRCPECQAPLARALTVTRALLSPGRPPERVDDDYLVCPACSRRWKASGGGITPVGDEEWRAQVADRGLDPTSSPEPPSA